MGRAMLKMALVAASAVSPPSASICRQPSTPTSVPESPASLVASAWTVLLPSDGAPSKRDMLPPTLLASPLEPALPPWPTELLGAWLSSLQATPSRPTEQLQSNARVNSVNLAFIYSSRRRRHRPPTWYGNA